MIDERHTPLAGEDEARELPRRAAAPIVLAAAAFATYGIPGLTELAEFHRDRILEGQAWRLVTGHWAHASTGHLVWDVLTFLVLGLAVSTVSRRLFRWTVLASAAGISGYVLFATELTRYRGLSGIDTALFAALAVQLLTAPGPRNARWIGGIGLGLLIAKLVYEATTGETLFVSDASGFVVATGAHLVGAVAGALTGYLSRRESDAAR